MNTFENKTALVTGASYGIGLAIANDLSKRGAHVILTARSAEKLEAAVNSIEQQGGTADFFVGDLSKPNGAAQLHQEISETNLHVDLLINNAGYGRWGGFTDFDREDYASMIQLNITSLTELCHFFIPKMVKKNGGGVINIGSTASFLPVPYASVYSSSKGYVLLFSEALRYEYSENNIRIMASCPGATDSNFRNIASEKSSKKLKERIIKMKDSGQVGDSCETVAKETLDAFLKNKHYMVPGKGNSKFAFLPRILSRARSLKIAGDAFRTHTAN
jgi:uncharacterized protein